MPSMSTPSTFETVSSVSEVVSRYDGFLIDQWGVMHNGASSMEHAPECISYLASLGKKMVILSNSPSDEEATLQALVKIGFDPSHFNCGAVTSGMLAAAYLKEQFQGCKAMVMAWKHEAAPPVDVFLGHCGDIQIVDSIDENPSVLVLQGCELLMASSKKTDSPQGGTSLGDYVVSGNMEKIDPILRECAKRQIPVVCVDPDFISYDPDGTVYYMPGTIAKRYEEEYGGKVLYFGKPHAAGFEEGMKRLQAAGVRSTSRMAMIGDSLHHDVDGASKVGIDSILVLGGVHRKDLGNDLGGLPPHDNLEALFQRENLRPTVVAPLLKI